MGILGLLTVGALSSGCVSAKHNKIVSQGINRAPKTKMVWTVEPAGVYSTKSFTTVKFQSSPPGAIVQVGDSPLGTTPLVMRYPHLVDLERQSQITYLEELRVSGRYLGAAVGSGLLGGVTFGGSILVELAAAKKGAWAPSATTSDYQVSGSNGMKNYVFPEKVLSNSPTGRSREIPKPEERTVTFRYEDFVGQKTLHLPKDDKVEFDFGSQRKAKPVTLKLRLDSDDAYLGAQSPTNASVMRTADSTTVSLAGLEQDGIGRWWFKGQEVKNHAISLRLYRATGQWVPPEEAIIVNLPQKYAVGPVELSMGIPLKAIPWSWTRKTESPRVDATVISGAQREAWKAGLEKAWASRATVPNLQEAVVSGMFLQALGGDDAARIREELGAFLQHAAARRMKVASPNFRKVDPATDTALVFEIQEDTLRNVRDSADAFFRISDPTAQQVNPAAATQPPDYVMLVDVVNITIDTQERIARSAGKVQIGTRRQANSDYSDLLKARVASEHMLARIAVGGIEAGAAASKQEGDALMRLLVGGALANRNLLSSADSGGILLGVVDSFFGADASKQKAQAYNAQLAQAQSAVNEISRRLSLMSEFNEEPIYQDFRTEDRFVVKRAIATAYIKVVAPSAPERELFSRKVFSDVTVSDTFEEANPTLGKKGKPLDLPSDQQMKRNVASKLTQEVSQQIRDGFLFRVGLEHYAQAKVAEKQGNIEKFAEGAVAFLLSPAARAHPAQAHDALMLLDGLIRRATRSSQNQHLDKLFGLEPKGD